MTTDVSLNTALQQQASTSNSSTQLASDFTQFLTLLTTQLQNQDPLSPMDTTEFTNQLVAFSGVEQQINANQKLDSLVSLGLTNSFTSALGYVGMEASYISSEFNYDGTNPSEIRYAIDGNAVEATISILDESGNEVYSEPASLSGSDTFAWDGTLKGGGMAEAGTYQVRINALDADNQPIDATTVVKGIVKGVETQNGTIFALVGERAVPVGSILNANKPEETAASETPTDETDQTPQEGA